MKKINWKVLVASFVIVILVAFLGSLFTSSNTKSAWYESIKPSITPPNFVFPIAWGILFFLIALSLYFAWTKAKNKEAVILVFGVNFFLNILWSFLFFQLKNPLLAFVEIIFLWLSTLSMIIVNWRISKLASMLLVPYLLWVSFASILNFLAI